MGFLLSNCKDEPCSVATKHSPDIQAKEMVTRLDVAKLVNGELSAPCSP